jgi:hypothetical protein
MVCEEIRFAVQVGKRAGSGTLEWGGKDDVQTYRQGRISGQRAPLVQLVHAVWQFFQGAGEEVMIPVWALQERSATTA